MPGPQEVFDDPDRHWAFLTSSSDAVFEGQHFDRKEACQPDASNAVSKSAVRNLIGQITECISAFANANVEGGLLVLGISSNGKVEGVDHLTEGQRNNITDIDCMLLNQSTHVKYHECQDHLGNPKQLILMYVDYTDNAICETPGRNPRAWMRRGSQNVPLTQTSRDRLKNQKGIVNFERSPCCDFRMADVDPDVLNAFRREFIPDSARQLTDEEVLYQAGAIIRTDSGYSFTNAGLLFFGTNPQRVIPSARIRLMRFGVAAGDIKSRGLPTFDKDFTGPVTKQIRDARTFFHESGFFKRYQVRRPGGGFAEEPEYPQIAVDEAIVNAVAHRDYAMGLPVECEAYADTFIVRNPGRMIQRDRDLPDEFSLADRVLDSAPRNPKLLEWLRTMKDPQGRSFVQAISEGTKRMAAEMQALSLPPPSYRLSEGQTELRLVSNASIREATLVASAPVETTEYTNLYPLLLKSDSVPQRAALLKSRRKEFLSTLQDSLEAHGWYIDRGSFSRVVTHRRGGPLAIPGDAALSVHLYPAYQLQVREYHGEHYLCVDYTVEVRNVRRLNHLLRWFTPDAFAGRRIVVSANGWRTARIKRIDGEWATVQYPNGDEESVVSTADVIPDCSLAMICDALKKEGIRFDLHQAIKKYSLASETGAARARADKIQSFVDYAADTLFPIMWSNIHVYLGRVPAQLAEHGASNQGQLVVCRLGEPEVEFREHHSLSDVRDGITRYGAYEDGHHAVELIPICYAPNKSDMEGLIERLKTGKYKYRGAERTFGTKFTYPAIITVDHAQAIRRETERLLAEHPSWVGDRSLRRIFLVHTPEKDYPVDDEESPYYTVKRYLLEQGVPCQMVDTPTLKNPDWKDLNLALNIVAKCGVTPWVLPDAIPDADFFIGLSYTQSRDKQRIMGFANVFNQYGKWEFYSGNTTAFAYEERAASFAVLVRETLTKLTLSQTPSIIFHYSARFSREDRDTIVKAARSVRPQGSYTFVSVNSHHGVRLFDKRPETDGSLRRGSYVQVSPQQVFLSTTGYNPFRKAMGTPKPIELTAWVFRPGEARPSSPDMRSIAVQILNLTKLNWASTDAFCGEPITIKYAGDIAYLTAAFQRQSEPFSLHAVLEHTPWFI